MKHFPTTTAVDRLIDVIKPSYGTQVPTAGRPLIAPLIRNFRIQYSAAENALTSVLNVCLSRSFPEPSFNPAKPLQSLLALPCPCLHILLEQNVELNRSGTAWLPPSGRGRKRQSFACERPLNHGKTRRRKRPATSSRRPHVRCHEVLYAVKNLPRGDLSVFSCEGCCIVIWQNSLLAYARLKWR